MYLTSPVDTNELQHQVKLSASHYKEWLLHWLFKYEHKKKFKNK